MHINKLPMLANNKYMFDAFGWAYWVYGEHVKCHLCKIDSFYVIIW